MVIKIKEQLPEKQPVIEEDFLSEEDALKGMADLTMKDHSTPEETILKVINEIEEEGNKKLGKLVDSLEKPGNAPGPEKARHGFSGCTPARAAPWLPARLRLPCAWLRRPPR